MKYTEEDEDEGLEDDDLELLEENTGTSFKKRLTRLRRGRDSGSPPVASSSKRKALVESSDDDLDLDNEDLPRVQDIQSIFKDDDDDVEMDQDDMDGFIDYDEEEEGAGQMGEEEREERLRERQREKQRRKAMGSRPELAGIDAK